MKHWNRKLWVSAMALAISGHGFAKEVELFGQTVDFSLTGYVRQYLGMNLQDKEQRRAGGGIGGMLPENGKEIGGAGELSMHRYQVKLEGSADFGWARFVVVERSVREILTNYEKTLQDSSAIVPARLTVFGQESLDNSFLPLAKGQKDFLSEYNEDALREAYVDFNIGSRLHFRLGRQQIAWGETDFARAMDVINGYDQRWRSFIETENEELRKPGTMANVTMDIPELGGSLQAVVRPGGIDSARDYGTTLDLFGGRWAPTPVQGLNIPAWIAPYNYHHDKGDIDDTQWGLRWSGVAWQIGYSFAYWHGNLQTPVANCRRSLTNYPSIVINPSCTPYGDPVQDSALEALAGEIIYPEQDMFGFSFNAYSMPIDTVIRGEFAFFPNQPWNYGTHTLIGLPAGTYPWFPFGDTGIRVPGLSGVIEKDTLVWMLGADKNVNLMQWLGTERPSLLTVQFFDTWILNYDAEDDIVEVLTYGAKRREHSPLVTAALMMNYNYDKINPGLAVGVDPNAGDFFMIPSVNFVYGDHWRVLVEADLFFPRSKKEYFGQDENDTRALGTTANNSQLMVRTTYQF